LGKGRDCMPSFFLTQSGYGFVLNDSKRHGSNKLDARQSLGVAHSVIPLAAG